MSLALGGNCVNQTMKPSIPDKVIGLKDAHIVVKLPEEFSECGIIDHQSSKRTNVLLALA